MTRKISLAVLTLCTVVSLTAGPAIAHGSDATKRRTAAELDANRWSGRQTCGFELRKFCR